MNILVCIGHVPETTSKIAFKEDNTVFDKIGVNYVIGPYENYALGRALELKQSIEAKVDVLNVGTPDTEQTIRKTLALGINKAIRIDAHPQNGYYVAHQIVNAIKESDYDMVLMGKESIDYNGSMVHEMVGELLNRPTYNPISSLDIKNDNAYITLETESSKQYLEVCFPFIAGCQEPIAEWKLPSARGIIKSRRKPITVLQPIEMEDNLDILKFELAPTRQSVKLIDKNDIDEVVSVLKNQVRVL